MGVAPEPLEESLTLSRVMFVMEEGLEASIYWFCIGVATYSRRSERHLP